MTEEEIAAQAAADAAASAAAESAAAEEAAAAAELAAAEEAAAAAEDAGKDAKALSVEKAKLLREVMDKKTKLKDAEKKAADAAAALAAYEGVDPAKVRELLKKEADTEKAALEARGDFDRLKTMMADEHAKDKKSLEERIAELDGKLAEKDKVINELTVGNDFASSTFLKDNTTLTPNKARKLYGDHFEVVDGKTVGYDKPAGQTNRTMMVDASGNPLNLDAALKRIVEVDPDKDTLLKAKVNQGSGSSTVIVAKQDQANKPKFATGLDRIRASFDK